MTLSNRLEFLCNIVFRLNKAKIEYWIDFGTLLGFYRQGDFLETDPDIDIGVKREEQDKVIELMKEVSKYFKVITRVENGYLAGYKIYYEDTWIDIAFYFKCGNKRLWTISQWEQVMVFDEKYFEDLQDLEVKGVHFKIPNHIEELMVLKYGSDWKRPFKPGEEYDLHSLPNIESNKKYLKCLK
jgi:phosphorylcholine metabolism protein LicD